MVQPSASVVWASSLEWAGSLAAQLTHPWHCNAWHCFTHDKRPPCCPAAPAADGNQCFSLKTMQVRRGRAAAEGRACRGGAEHLGNLVCCSPCSPA